MRFATIRTADGERAVVHHGENFYRLDEVLGDMVFDVTSWDRVFASGDFTEVKNRLQSLTSADQAWARGEGYQASTAEFGPLFRHPRKIWGIGLNYREHAGDLKAHHPTDEPASFMKADTTIIGPLDTICLPTQSERVTAEAELGIVIGRECRNVSEEDSLNYVAGFTTILDMTAEDILQKNPRFLTRAKNFDTFFSVGPDLITPEDISSLADLRVRTVLNGKLHRENRVLNMTFSPTYLIAFHSAVMTLLPGDIIATGTPGAAIIRDGDVVSCEIDGFTTLVNRVVR